MDYHQAKEYIKSLSGRGIVPGLGNIEKLLSELSNPEEKLNIIHVAGTNGKGSFGAYLSSVVTASKKRCGRFVSPCVGEYENTFLIDGESVSQDIIASCCQTLKGAMEKLEKTNIFPTSFEAETALALLIFAEISPDYVIIECGMGGKSDATNVIEKPVLSVITKISLDHSAFLGNTITEIAEQKAGIIKPCTPVVSAVQDSNAMAVIESVCKNNASTLYIADTPTLTGTDDSKTEFELKDGKYTTHMLGTYQPENASLAISAAKVLGIPIDAIKTGIEKARWAYRFERIGKFILDGAHNPDGATALAKSLELYTKPEDTAFICACFKDKDYNKIAEITAPYAKTVYCITAPTERGLDNEILCDTFKAHGANAQCEDTLEDAIKKAYAFKTTVIFGTLSVLADAKQITERLQ